MLCTFTGVSTCISTGVSTCISTGVSTCISTGVSTCISTGVSSDRYVHTNVHTYICFVHYCIMLSNAVYECHYWGVVLFVYICPCTHGQDCSG